MNAYDILKDKFLQLESSDPEFKIMMFLFQRTDGWPATMISEHTNIDKIEVENHLERLKAFYFVRIRGMCLFPRHNEPNWHLTYNGIKYILTKEFDK